MHSKVNIIEACAPSCNTHAGSYIITDVKTWTWTWTVDVSADTCVAKKNLAFGRDSTCSRRDRAYIVIGARGFPIETDQSGNKRFILRYTRTCTHIRMVAFDLSFISFSPICSTASRRGARKKTSELSRFFLACRISPRRFIIPSNLSEMGCERESSRQDAVCFRFWRRDV